MSESQQFFKLGMQEFIAGNTDPQAIGEDMPVLLVVDDDPDILRVVRFYLTKQQYTVHTATCGTEALAILDKERDIELILSDVMMPEMSGLELLTIVRENPDYADIPMILISAEGETAKKVAGLNLGADDFITKPFNFDELMARVKNHIRLRRLQMEVMVASRQALQANKMLQVQNDRFLEDLEAARSLQMSLMPDKFPEYPQIALASRYLPAEELGGDFFDVVALDDGRKLGVLIADVCGHGVTAAFITAMTKIAFQNSCYSSFDPSVVLTRMNGELTGNLKNGFVTVFYGVYDLVDKSFAYASGGHPPLLLHRRSAEQMVELMPQATFLGFFEPVEYRTDTVILQPGDRLIFYTDGLYECQRVPGDDFGIERVTGMILTAKDKGLDSLLHELINSLIEFMDGGAFDDDITIVGLDVRD